jgi:hypothetical protein
MTSPCTGRLMPTPSLAVRPITRLRGPPPRGCEQAQGVEGSGCVLGSSHTASGATTKCDKATQSRTPRLSGGVSTRPRRAKRGASFPRAAWTRFPRLVPISTAAIGQPSSGCTPPGCSASLESPQEEGTRGPGESCRRHRGALRYGAECTKVHKVSQRPWSVRRALH